jgi:hypothetical protein
MVRPGVLHNPNKETLTRVVDPTALLVPAAAADAIAVVWPRDTDGVAALAGLLGEVRGNAELSSLPCRVDEVTLWWLRGAQDRVSDGSVESERARLMSTNATDASQISREGGEAATRVPRSSGTHGNGHGALVAFAEEVVLVRDRRHGVLANPHLAYGAVLHEPPTIDALARCIQRVEAA